MSRLKSICSKDWTLHARSDTRNGSAICWYGWLPARSAGATRIGPKPICKKGLAVARTIKNRERMSHLLVNLGAVALYRGDMEMAEGYLQESVALARVIDHQERLSHALQKTSELARKSGDYKQADLLLKESLGLARSLGHSPSYM